MPWNDKAFANHAFDTSYAEGGALTYGTGLAFDEEFHKSLQARAYDRSFFPEGTVRQLLAVLAQEDREEDLRQVTIPSLIVHGDSDPLVPMSGGKATADAIPGSEFMVVKGMGHVLPNLDAYWGDIKDAMLKHMRNAG
jgi:pimeloyl-ACP methyl ester carboxylesterase